MVSRKRLLACAVGGVMGGGGFFALYYFGTYSAFGGDAFRSLLLPSVVGVVMGGMLGWAIGARRAGRGKVAGRRDATGEGVDV